MEWCWICYEPLDEKDAVETSKAPWHLESGRAHRDCADECARLAEMGRADAEAEYHRDNGGRNNEDF